MPLALRQLQSLMNSIMRILAVYCLSWVLLVEIKGAVLFFYPDPIVPNDCQSKYFASTGRKISQMGLAVQFRDLECVKEFLEFGGHPNGVGHGGKPPIEIAAENGDAPMLKLLLSYGAQIGSAVTIAVCRGHAEGVKVLVDAGANTILEHPCSHIKKDVAYFLAQTQHAVLFNTELPSTGGIINHGRDVITANNRECWMLCEQTTSCAAWTRFKRDAADGRREGECWLRAYTPKRRPNTFCDSGTKNYFDVGDN